MAMPTIEPAGSLRRRGVTLVELLVSLAIGLVVVLAAMAAFGGSRQLYSADAEARTVEDSLRFAAFVVQRIARQAGYVDYTPDRVDPDAALVPAGLGAPDASSRDDPLDLHIVGARDTRVSATGEGYGRHRTRGVNGSDSLLVRFFGRSRAGSDGNEPDGTMIDCMGYAQAGPPPAGAGRDDRAWSLFYIAEAADKEPELYCKYRDARGAFRAEPLARGIEMFRVVFGHDADGDGSPERWLDAEQLDALAPSATAANAAWRQVVALRVGMVARSARDGIWPRTAAYEALQPLGPDFPSASFRPRADGRLRRVATFTVMLRNAQREPGS